MSIILKTPSNGSVTLAEQDTASDVVVTVPAVTATLLNNSSGVMNIGSGQVVKDAAGNLGLGVTPSAWVAGFNTLSASRDAVFGGATGGAVYLFAATNAYATDNGDPASATWRYKLTGSLASRYDQFAGVHRWYTAPSGTAGNAISFTQAMTLDASGNLLSKWTALDSWGVDGVAIRGPVGRIDIGASTTVAASKMYFANPNGVVGQIYTSGSSTSYATSSDYRLKENVAPMAGALAIVAALKPCTYNWKADGSAGQGFIAHELQAVVPDCVSGTKDAVDAEGNPQYQGIDVSFLVATLTAAIQEQQAIITQLQADVAALQGAA